ncbi:MAG: hypothetical protein CMJ76_08900 [Planctomycetaceae bacterium]|nr:hypothetical protein [Planctomycetaceae bacterium]
MKVPSIAELAQRIRSKQLTISDLVTICLDRIDQVDSEIQAWVAVDQDWAFAEADRLQSEIDSGQDRGLLHGIPMGIKDIIDVAGFPTRAGTDWRIDTCTQHAPLVQNLLEAGVIVLGKTVTTQFAGFDPSVTRNPAAPDRTPGGSSSGSAAAVAAGMCIAAIGSQTGGSINRPASYCGIVGLKPAFGEVSTKGVVPLSRNLDHLGPLANTVDDAVICYQALKNLPVGRISSVEVDVLRIDGFFRQGDDQVNGLIDQLAGHLDTINCPVDFNELTMMHQRLMAGDAADVHQLEFDEYCDRYATQMASQIEIGRRQSAQDYLEAINYQSAQRQAVCSWLDKQQVVIMPATTSPPPGMETTGDPKFNSPWSFLGLPALSVPRGLSVEGFPLCIQFVGRTVEAVVSAARQFRVGL